MKDLLLRARVVVRTSNMKISRRRLADYDKTLHQKACRTCSTIIFLHTTNQIIDLWRCRRRCRRQILNSLLRKLTMQSHLHILIKCPTLDPFFPLYSRSPFSLDQATRPPSPPPREKTGFLFGEPPPDSSSGLGLS